MLDLPHITLCCIDTRFPVLGLDALHRSMKDIRFGDTVLITSHNGIDYDEEKDLIRLVFINEIRSIDEYSQFVLKSLSGFIHTPYVLLIQWDGYIINPQAWSDRFLDFDYIGAPWLQKDGSKIVGNGGFSLRSRKLLNALKAEGILYHHPEDECIAKTNRTLMENRFGIRFAEPAIADIFAFEFTTPVAPTFGFHGFCNFPDVMSSKELYHFVTSMPNLFVYNGYFPRFLERLYCKASSNPAYNDTLTKVLQIITESFDQTKVSGLVSGKLLIKSLIHCNMYQLAKKGLKTRIAASGYVAENIRLIARYVAKRAGLRM